MPYDPWSTPEHPDPDQEVGCHGPGCTDGHQLDLEVGHHDRPGWPEGPPDRDPEVGHFVPGWAKERPGPDHVAGHHDPGWTEGGHQDPEVGIFDQR